MDFSFFSSQPISFWLVVVSYCVLLAWVSVYFTRYVKSTDDFFRASGHTPWFISGLSFIMTAFSAGVFVANASLAYNHGGVNLMLVFTQLSIFVCGYFFFARRWHRSKVKTAIEFIETRYNRSTAKFFVWTGVPMRVLDNANRLYVTSVLLEAVFGIRLWTGIVFTAVITLVYTVFGGFIAIVVTDSLQAIVLGIIVMIMSVMAYVKVGGFEGFMDKVPEGYWNLNPEGSDWGMLFVIAWLFVGILSWNGVWSLVQRYICVETESDAKKVSIVGGFSYLLLFTLLALPPMFAAALIPGLEGTAQAEQSYMMIAQMILPASLLGVLFFAIFGATVTALNSELNVLSQVIVEDMLKKVMSNRSEKFRLLFSRLSIVVVLTLCVCISLGIRSFGGSLKYLLTIFGLTSLPTFIPMLMGLFYRKTPAWGCILSFCNGLAVSLVMTFVFDVYMPYVIFVNGIITTATMLVVGEMYPVSGNDKKRIDVLFARLTVPNSGNPPVSEPAKVQGIMLPLISISLVVMGIIVMITSFIGNEGTQNIAGIISSMAFFAAAAVIYVIRRKLATN